ncbi:MAG: hypothetical protein ACKVIH_01260 [Burkholderiales bacterium]
MNRCLAPALLLRKHVALMLAFLLAGQCAWAQITKREFPVAALRGTLTVTAPPEALVDGKAARLSPGARIYNQQNLIQLSGSLVGQPLLVNYTRDSVGNVHLVWVLTAEEAREKRPQAAGAPGFFERLGL